MVMDAAAADKTKLMEERVYLFANDSKINNATIMAWQEQKCKLRRRSNNDRWIIHPEFSMVVRSEFRQEERVEEENKSQTFGSERRGPTTVGSCITAKRIRLSHPPTP
jgi:hypothetical protein